MDRKALTYLKKKMKISGKAVKTCFVSLHDWRQGNSLRTQRCEITAASSLTGFGLHNHPDLPKDLGGHNVLVQYTSGSKLGQPFAIDRWKCCPCVGFLSAL